jgi:uncharacterized protein (DUF2141 family)
MAVPTGGEKDRVPPALVQEKCFPQNGSVNFNSRTIHLRFDEYVKLTNPRQNILISPEMPSFPEFVLKGKDLFIHLPDSLTPNTTYTIFFGNAITDMHEGNPANDLSYVFSTGAVIDSLSVIGKVTDAFMQTPEKGVMVGLYRQTGDSVVFKQRPYYLAMTNESGAFQLRNVAAGKYAMYALLDKNGNYKYDPSSDEIAFLDSMVDLSNGKSAGGIQLSLFNEQQYKYQMLKKDFTEPGKLFLQFNKEIKSKVRISFPSIPDQEYVHYPHGDTLEIWLKNENTDVVFLELDDIHGKIFRDTIRFTRDKKKYENGMLSGLKAYKNYGEQMSRKDDLTFRFSDAFSISNVNGLSLYRDSVVMKDARFEVLRAKELQVHFSFSKAAKENFSIVIAPGALIGANGSANKGDTLSFRVFKQEYYGTLKVNLKKVPFSNTRYELVNDKGKIVAGFSSSAPVLDFPMLEPGTYKLRCYNDRNGDLRWTTGNLMQRIQPEEVILMEQAITVRSNWDMELEWNF